ncbi:MAG: head-tail joining protein [Cyanobacteria bacterium P01_A01_bin.40]
MLEDFENLDDFTDNEFSTTATVTPLSSTSPLAGGTELTGIFDENYQDMFGSLSEHGHTAEGRKFCFQVQTGQIDDLRHGDRLTINSKNYQVASIQPKHDGKLSNIILKQDFS